MITNKSATHTNSVQAHTLLHIHLECMAVLSRLEDSSRDCSSKYTGQQVHLTKRAWPNTGWVLLALMLVLSSGVAHAQSTAGSIRGVVQDKTGAVVPESQITLHSNDESTDRVVAADASGAFVLENLKPGHFSLRAHHNGFADASLTGIVLEPRQDLRLTVEIAIAEQTTTVEVSAAADQINTEDVTLGDLKESEELTQLPLNNRATTTSPLGALALSSNVQQDSQGNIALGGASSSMVGYSVDGISTSNVRANGALQDAYPSQEGIANVKVSASNNNAEFSQAGDVTFTTKSGTSTYHGSLFEYMQNDALDAIPYGFTSKNPKRFNTFGGSLGGPVSIPHLYQGKDHTFFFFDYEGNRRATAVAEQYLVPSALDRQGNLSDIGGPTLAAGQISATAKAVLNYYPLPNVNGQSNYNYEAFQPTPSRTDGADLRLDQTINQKQSIYARVSRKNITSDSVNPLLPNDVDSIHNRSLLVSYTNSLTQRIVNEFRFGFTNVTTNVDFPIEGADALSQLGLAGVNISQHPTTHAFPTFNFSAGTNFTPIGRDKAGVTQSGTYQFTDNVTHSRGKHTFKAGIDLRRVRYADEETFEPSDDFGQFTFQPNFTGNSFGDFLIGAPTTLFFAVSSPDVAGTAVQSSLFAQDEFQLTSRITLSYGLRWQMLPAFQELGGNLANFDQRTNSIVVPDNLASYLSKENLQASNLGFQQSFNVCNLGYTALPCSNYITASQDHLPSGLRNPYYGDYQPRFAIAYRPFNDTRTVARAGFGIYTMTNLGPLSFNNSGNPTSALHTYSNTTTASGALLIQFPNTAPPSIGVAYGAGGLDQGVDPNYRDPQSSQWNLTIERQIGNATTARVSYVGMHTYRLNITEDLNQIPSSTTPYVIPTRTPANPNLPVVDPRAPHQNWDTLYSTFNAGKQNYRSFEGEVTHRIAKGLNFDASYTLARNLADNQGDTPTAFAGEVNYGLPIADRFHIASDYGNVEGTRRDRFLVTGAYQLPLGVGRTWLNTNRWLDKAVGGWQLTNITLLETGPWLTPSISPSYDASNTNVVNRGAALRPDVVSTNYDAVHSRTNYFNPAAFAQTPTDAGRFGNAGVGILQGPGTEAVSLGLGKVFNAGEHMKIRFESTFTNVLNHTNFAPPSSLQVIPDANGHNVNSAFGALSTAQTAESAGNRTGQVALRIDF
jgi:Carboxypeptidase regulatory-like domain